MLALLLILALSEAEAPAATQKPCWMELILRRGTRGLISQKMPSELEEFSPVELVRSLQRIHIQQFQAGFAGTRRFNPNWIFTIRDSTARDLLVKRLRPGFDLGDGQEASLVALVDEWERAFLAAGGELDTKWRQKGAQKLSGRDRFLRRLSVHLAYDFHSRQALQPQPEHFARDAENLDWTLLPGYVELSRIYRGDLTAFQQDYRDHHRRLQHARTPLVARMPLAVYRATRQVRRAGAKVATTPVHRSADARSREQNELIQVAVHAISASPEYGLSALAWDDTGLEDSNHTAVSFEVFSKIEEHFGNLRHFVMLLNDEFSPSHMPPLLIGALATSYEEEWLIEYGARLARSYGHPQRPFPGLQIAHRQEQFYISAEIPLIRRALYYSRNSNLVDFMAELNAKIRKRAISRPQTR